MSKTSFRYSLGVDYGTNSVRALLVDLHSGSEVVSAVFDYPSGEHGVLLDPKEPLLARQNPADYIEGFYAAVSEVVRKAKRSGFKPEQLIGIGTDTTGSTPVPVNKDGTALAMLPEFKNELAAQAWLWKDHTSFSEAAKITEKAKQYTKNGGTDYLAKCGGTYSSEWYWSKILHCKKENPRVFRSAYSWIEQADFIPAFLTGNTNPDTMPRGICAAGHKGMYHTSWGGFPSREFLNSLDKELTKFRIDTPMMTANQQAGILTEDAAKRCGLVAGIPVAVGAIDAHFGAVGAGIKAGTLVKIMGTSTCDMMVFPADKPLADIQGVCGIVPGSIIPDMYGIEAGQSAVGDLFNWFCNNLVPSAYTSKGEVHINLSKEAEKLHPGESGLLALDWNNGNRCILTDPLLSGLILGMTLHTTAPEIYRTLIEATAFGAMMIINRIESYGVKVKEVINCGGIAVKSPLAMQIYADVCNRPMKISPSEQTCALGAAIMGATAGRAFSNVAAAQRKLCTAPEKIYIPQRKNVIVYQKLFGLYQKLHDAFGTQNYNGTLDDVMKTLIELRR